MKNSLDYIMPNGFDFKNFSKDIDLSLRNLFRNEIKGNFLIKVYHSVINQIDINQYYHFSNSLIQQLTGGSEPFSYDICKIIVGLHKSKNIFKSETEINKLQNDDKYINNLTNEVIENIKLRKYGSFNFRQNQINYGDRFNYFSMPYDLFVICMKMNELYYLYRYEDIPFFSLLSKISNMGLSALSLLEDNFLENAYPICRNVLELFFHFLALINNKNAIKIYNNLSKIRVASSQCGIDYPNEFYELYNNRIKKQFEGKTEYLNYGWVDYLKNYHNVVSNQNNPYTIKSLIYYLENTNEDNLNLSGYEKLYNQCHVYSHANILKCSYPLLHYFEISLILSLPILYSYERLCQFLHIDSKINYIDILNKSYNDREILIEQYNKRSTENFEKYYTNYNSDK